MKRRKSNLELYRIIVMHFIIAHHYLVNSGILTEINSNNQSFKSLWLFVFGAWGKTGINCFILITGFFMCKSNVDMKKWLKLMGEIVFYNVTIYLIFVLTGYEVFSYKELVKAIVPIRNITTGFYSCYLVFYLFIPFVNILINQINEKQHLILLGLCLGVYSVWGSNPFIDLSMNYVSWFMIVYLIGAYIRIYPKKNYTNCKLWTKLTLIFFVLGIGSVVILSNSKYSGGYYLVHDSNKIFAVLISTSSFILFANLPIGYNKWINKVAKSVFAVLLIHTSCDSMLNWLWKDMLHTPEMYYSQLIYVHAIISVIVVFAVSVVIDFIRIEISVCICNCIASHTSWCRKVIVKK